MWKFVKYDRPDDVGWAGWIEVCGQVIAFIGLDRRITWSAKES